MRRARSKLWEDTFTTRNKQGSYPVFFLKSWNKTFSFIPQITDLVISTNGIPSYFNQSRSCKQLPHPQTHLTLRHFFIDYRHVHTMPRSSSPQFCRQNISLWIKIVSTNIYGGTMSKNFEIFQNFSKFWNFSKFFLDSLFWALGLLPTFGNSFVTWGLTTFPSSDVSISFPDAFFTVMPKGLTSGPKSRTDWSGLVSTWNFLYPSSRLSMFFLP